MGVNNESHVGDRAMTEDLLSRCLIVYIENIGVIYEMESSDLFKIFSRYGKVQSVNTLMQGELAIVFFCRIEDALVAKNDLNFRTFKGIDGHLRVQSPCEEKLTFHDQLEKDSLSWLDNTAADNMQNIESQDLNATTWVRSPESSLDKVESHAAKLDMINDISSVRRFMARYSVQIDPFNGFDVSRRIIGNKGSNMKTIYQATESKLRLRGYGSGHLEGFDRQESMESLQLCISSSSFEQYNQARKLVEDLLNLVYRDYDAWLQAKNMKPEKLTPKCREELSIQSNKSNTSPNLIYSNSNTTSSRLSSYRSYKFQNGPLKMQSESKPPQATNLPNYNKPSPILSSNDDKKLSWRNTSHTGHQSCKNNIANAHPSVSYICSYLKDRNASLFYDSVASSQRFEELQNSSYLC